MHLQVPESNKYHKSIDKVFLARCALVAMFVTCMFSIFISYWNTCAFWVILITKRFVQQQIIIHLQDNFKMEHFYVLHINRILNLIPNQ